MNITEVRITPAPPTDPRLVGFASITLDGCFVVRDIRILRRPDGSLFVAMPSRVITDACWKCQAKVPLTAKFCSHCGIRQRPPADDFSGAMFADVAHPISPECRAVVEAAVIEALAEPVAH